MAAATAVTVKADFREKSASDMKLIAEVRGAEHTITIASREARGAESEFTIDEIVGVADVEEVEPAVYSILVGTRSFEVKIEEAGERYFVAVNGRRFEISIRDPRRSAGRTAAVEAGGRREVTSPMPGKVVKVLVEEGEEVLAGQGLVVVEAMKMQNEIKSPKSGRVTSVHVSADSSVRAGGALVVIE